MIDFILKIIGVIVVMGAAVLFALTVTGVMSVTAHNIQTGKKWHWGKKG